MDITETILDLPTSRSALSARGELIGLYYEE